MERLSNVPRVVRLQVMVPGFQRSDYIALNHYKHSPEGSV